jgi:hypothetical protein
VGEDEKWLILGVSDYQLQTMRMQAIRPVRNVYKSEPERPDRHSCSR